VFIFIFLQIAEEKYLEESNPNSCVLKKFPGKSVVSILLISVLGCFLGIYSSVPDPDSLTLDPDSLIPDPDSLIPDLDQRLRLNRVPYQSRSGSRILMTKNLQKIYS
jgi:hypothetical protein